MSYLRRIFKCVVFTVVISTTSIIVLSCAPEEENMPLNYQTPDATVQSNVKSSTATYYSNVTSSTATYYQVNIVHNTSGEIIGGGSYQAGSQVRLIAIPETNNPFVEWGGDVPLETDLATTTLEFIIDRDYTIMPIFKFTPIENGWYWVIQTREKNGINEAFSDWEIFRHPYLREVFNFFEGNVVGKYRAFLPEMGSLNYSNETVLKIKSTDTLNLVENFNAFKKIGNQDIVESSEIIFLTEAGDTVRNDTVYYEYNLGYYGREKPFPTNVSEIENPQGFMLDTIYSKIDFNNPHSYLRAFIKDASRNGVDLSYLDFEGTRINIFFGDLELCRNWVICNGNDVLVQIDQKVWNNAAVFDLRNERLWYMWHWFGHTILDLEHSCYAFDIMFHWINSGNECNGNVISNYDDGYNIYSRGFNKAASRMFRGYQQRFAECD